MGRAFHCETLYAWMTETTTKTEMMTKGDEDDDKDDDDDVDEKKWSPEENPRKDADSNAFRITKKFQR